MFLGAVPDACNVEEARRYIAFEEALEGTEGHQLRPILDCADTYETYSWTILLRWPSAVMDCLHHPPQHVI